MCFRLIRGKTLEEVIEAYRRRTPEEGLIDTFAGTAFNCNMDPGPNTRDSGSLQRASFVIRGTPRHDYGETYHLLVICQRNWAGDELGPQKYAVVVTIEH